MQFADRIAAIRKQMRLSQEKFGELAEVSQRTVAFWESGDRMPSYETITLLADRLGLSVDYLLGREKNEQKKEPTVSDDELRADIISRVRSLSDPALVRVGDFLSGLEAGQAIGSAVEAARDPAGGSSPR